MSNKIKTFYITFIIVLFGWINFTDASFEITEIMYDLEGTDTNREWIEVQNTGSQSADFSEWFFFSDNSKHTLVPQGASSIPAGGYAVIVQNVTNFQADWPNYNGLIFDSSWTGFNNESGETISLKDPDLNEVSIVTFDGNMGAAGDGKSLQKIQGSWSGAIPTPGLANSGSSDDDNDDEEEEEDVDPNPIKSSNSNKKEVALVKMATNIITKNITFQGLPITIDAHTTGTKKEIIKVGKFVWNFGDGTSANFLNQQAFEHTYFYPGEYVLSLMFYDSIHDVSPDAIDRMIIKVVPSEIFISSVGKDSDPFIELENKSGYEIDLSRWVIIGTSNSFMIPNGTVFLPNKKLRFSPKITGFNSFDLAYLTLENPNREVMATYPVAKIPATSVKSVSPRTQSQDSINSNESSVINLNDLGASAANSDVLNFPKSSYAWFGLIGILIIGVVTTLILRNKNNKDEDINVDDIKIME